MVFYYLYEMTIARHFNSVIFIRIVFGDFQRTVSATIVDNRIIPVLVRLCQYALDAFNKILFSVIDRSYDADKRLRLGIHLIPR